VCVQKKDSKRKLKWRRKKHKSSYRYVLRPFHHLIFHIFLDPLLPHSHSITPPSLSHSVYPCICLHLCLYQSHCCLKHSLYLSVSFLLMFLSHCRSLSLTLYLSHFYTIGKRQNPRNLVTSEKML